jgi:signal peptidase II
MSRYSSILILAVLVLGLVGCDHATKRLAETELRGQPPATVIGNVLELRYTENRDIGFSLLRGIKERVRKPLIFALGSAGLMLMIAMWYRRRGARWPEQLAFALILGGALGNLTDRMFRGYVVDFIYLHHWPVFNAADVWLVAGGILLILAQRLQPSDPTPATEPAPG